MKGVTLLELVVTIVVLGIIAAVAAIFVPPAFESYFASQRRAEIADAADAALRRMTRDVRLALPNSARVDASSRFLEILMTKNGGRYRALNDDDTPVATAEDPLDFTAPDTIFDTLGPLPASGDQAVQPNDYVVIHNLGIAGANAYDVGAAAPNIARIAAFGAGALAGEQRITLASPTRFPLESPGRRFFVVSGPVTYACLAVGATAAGEGTGTLRRWSNYAIALRGGLPPTALPGGATEALLADHVSACQLDYTALPLQGRGLVGVRLAITRARETVTLYFEAQINNVP
jgi:MSHA biogenesis protein MshO